MDRKQAYAEKLKDPRWQKKRLEILERDGYQCQVCGNCRQMLHVHHSAYPPWSNDPWECDSDVLATVCADCHEEEHAAIRESIFRLMQLIGLLGARTSKDIDELVLTADQSLFTLRYYRVDKKNSPEEVIREITDAVQGFQRRRAKSISDGHWFE